MTIVYFLWYLIVGLVCTILVGAVHLWQAESEGYEALDYWTEHNDMSDVIMGEFMFGLCIWPIRIVEFINSLPYYYELYERKED